MKSDVKISYIDVMWWERKDLVEEELRRILGADTLDSSTQAYFEQRNAAIKRVYDSLPDSDKHEINNKVEHYRMVGFPMEVKQQ